MLKSYKNANMHKDLLKGIKEKSDSLDFSKNRLIELSLNSGVTSIKKTMKTDTNCELDQTLSKEIQDLSDKYRLKKCQLFEIALRDFVRTTGVKDIPLIHSFVQQKDYKNYKKQGFYIQHSLWEEIDELAKTFSTTKTNIVNYCLLRFLRNTELQIFLQENF